MTGKLTSTHKEKREIRRREPQLKRDVLNEEELRWEREHNIFAALIPPAG